jgi:phage terminase Nu1 subunit (DNA packaging protein)
MVNTACDAWLEYLEGRAPEPPSLTEEKRRAQQLKNEILEIDLLRKRGEVVDVKTMDYLFSFIGRGFHDCVTQIKVAMPEVKRLLKVDKDRDAERLLLANLQRTFGNVMEDVGRHIAEELGEPV